MTETAGAGGAARPTRMDGYVRVSRRMGREGPGYISPTIQREAILRWASFRDVEIVAWHEDEDESGGTQNRPGLREAMQRVAAGQTDGIACWRLNRFARNVSEALADVEKIHAAKGALACVEEDIDPTGPFGEFLLTVLLAVAALELNNIKASWRTAKATAMARGAIVGPTPFGFDRRGDGTLELSPTAAPVVREAFDVAATRGLHAALDYLLEHGEGRRWTTSTVRRMLSQRCYLGEFANGENRFSDPDLAIVGRATWEAAQPTGPKRRRPAAHFPLTGLATCASCGTHMVGARGGRDRKTGAGLRSYRCAASLSTWRGERCPAPATMVASRLEEHVRQIAAVAADEIAMRVVDQGERRGELAGALAAMEDAEAELDAILADLTLRRTLGDRYHAAVQLRVDAVEATSAHYRHLAARAATSSTQVDLGSMIREAAPEDLGELLRGMLGGIEVVRGRGPVEARVRLIALDDVPADGVGPAHDA